MFWKFLEKCVTVAVFLGMHCKVKERDVGELVLCLLVMLCYVVHSLLVRVMTIKFGFGCCGYCCCCCYILMQTRYTHV